MFDEGYTYYCEFLAAGGSFEEIQARDSICNCIELFESGRLEKFKDGLQKWSESRLNFLRK